VVRVASGHVEVEDAESGTPLKVAAEKLRAVG
jgi:hypothetical protein